MSRPCQQAHGFEVRIGEGPQSKLLGSLAGKDPLPKRDIRAGERQNPQIHKEQHRWKPGAL